MKRAAVFLSILVISSFCAGAQTQAERQIGRIYMARASAAFLLGEKQLAEKLLKTSEEFYTESSDYYYLKALLELDMRNDIKTASDQMAAAVKINDWLFFEKKECVGKLALLYTRTGLYKEAILLVENNIVPGIGDADLMFTYVTALRLSGSPDYRSRLMKAMYLFPQDYRFSMLYIDLNPVYAERVLNGEISFTNPEGGLKAVEKAVMSVSAPERRVLLLERLIASGTASVRSRIEYLRLTGGMDSESVKKLADSGLLTDRQDLDFLKSIIFRKDNMDLVERLESEFTGKIFDDLNGDAFYEQLFIYENGKPAGISLDMDQDGILEVMIVFSKGKPSEVYRTRDELTTRIVYSDYPEVGEISFRHGARLDVYTAASGRMFIDFYTEANGLAMPSIDYKALDMYSDRKPDFNDSIIKSSTYVNEQVRSEWLRHDEIRSSLNVYDSTEGNRLYLLEDTAKTAGFRDIDFDSDVDIREGYEDGRLVYIESDSDNDGYFEYRISIENGTETVLWDFDQDGKYDYTRYNDGEGTVSGFSTGMDGEFDLRIRN